MTTVRAVLANVCAVAVTLLGAGVLRAVGAPDVVLVVVAMVAVTRPRLEAVFLAAASGLVVDAFSAAALGHRAVPLAFIAWVLSRLSPNLNTTTTSVRCGILTLALVGALALEAALRASTTATTFALAVPSVTSVLVTTLIGMILWSLAGHQEEEQRAW